MVDGVGVGIGVGEVRGESAARARPGLSRVLAVCFGVPTGILLASYVWLAVEHGTLSLWDVVVHESGRYTLAQTVLYPAHFLREIPTVLAYALFVLGATAGVAGVQSTSVAGARGGGAGPATAGARVRGQTLVWVGLGGAAVLASGALLITASGAGWGSALRDLLQYRTRDDIVAYGSHWHYHWLSTLWFAAAVGCAPAAISWVTGTTMVQPSRFFERLAWGYFIVLTLVFGVSSAVFADVRYVGHQAREILTHGPVTALLGIGVVLAARHSLATIRDGARAKIGRGTWIRLLALFAIPLYLAAIALSGDVMDAGQSEGGLAAMIGAHYFEHSLDYLLVMLLVLGVVGLNEPRARSPV